jgi:proline iminopeptidase
MGSRAAARVTAVGVALVAYVFFARPRQLRWGATEDESNQPLAGDELIARAVLTATRAISVRTSPDRVWP